MITIESIKIRKIACGFCSTGNRHDLCPGGVLNGDQKTLVMCGCTEHPIVTRCLSCSHRGDEVSDETWLCLDLDACQDRTNRARREALGDFADAATAPKTSEPRKVARKAPVAGTDCRCSCGGQTKGGKYLPGHDSRHLSAVQALPATYDEKLAIFADSPALQAKLAKRLGA